MFRRVTKKWLPVLLAVVMIVGMLPQSIFAAETGSVTNYTDFMANLKVLEGYAEEYAAEIHGKDAGELVLNFIRTGVERYQDDNWNTLAGTENTGFTSYVEAEDSEKGTSAMSLKNIVIDNFKLPNGNKVDFGHMFGCMNISYVAPGSADLSGWAGDICDLLQYSVANIDAINANTDGSVEKMAEYIQAHCFGVDASGAFGWDDFWGDMDAYYLVSEYKKANGEKTFSSLMESYFGAESGLDDTDRTVYFMNNRFAVADSEAAVRKALYDAYSNDIGISILESKRGLSSYSSLRQACCYAVADYIYSKAQGWLIEGTPSDDGASNGYYTVFSNEHSILAPGIEQDINYAQTVDGKQIVYYVATVDVTRDDVDLFVNYNNNEAPVGNNIGLQSVRDQVNALVKNNKDKENFYPIVATNGAGFNITNGTPAGLVVMQGVEYYPVGSPGFFAILKDGTAVIGDEEKYNELKAEGKVKEAIQAFGSVLVKDGKVCVTKSANYMANRASRTAIGITDEGEVVMMVLDGRQLPRSAGGAMEEIAQIMLEAGCVEAVNLDGGGSTTYLSKPAGSDEIELINVPSDGYERRVSTSLVAVSTAAPSTAFDSAIISSDYEYITAGTSMQFSVTGVSNTGNAAPIPEGSYWKVSDENLATIDENGVFTVAWSEDAPVTGKVTVEFVVDGKVAGSKDIEIVIPDDIKFVEDRITAIYGEPKEIEVTVWYQGYPVAFTPFVDAGVVLYSIDEEGNLVGALENDGGILTFNDTGDKQVFIGDDSKGVRSVNIAATLVGDDSAVRFGTISLYYKDEATFDFENATMGNRSFAWNREIENARTLDNQLYRVSDPASPVEIEYTFALDMTAIDFPTQLEPMKSMLPTYNENSTAWDYLLQLAERVCTQTNVTIRAEFSKDLDVDISELKILTEYFTPTSINLDENNALTIVCNWVNQSQPIDPATANSLCLLTGIKATVKDTAAYYDNKIAITNNGTVSYDIYLAASSLYSFAQESENQAKYGLYPYIHEEDCRSDFSDPDAGGDTEAEGNKDKGARFSSQYVDFADAYLVSTEILNGWHEEGKDYYYYVNNVPVTGVQIVPDRHDATQNRIYEFDATGKLVSEQGKTGLVTVNGDLYYAVLGVAQTGWRQIDGNNYYFHPDTGKAVDGEFAIYESANSWQTKWYTYTFENHVLVKGAWEYDTYQGKSGWRYRWAGNWMIGCWFEAEGETYLVGKNYPYYVHTGYAHYVHDYRDGQDTTGCYIFDDRGKLQKDYVGPKYVEWASGSGTLFFKNGVLYTTNGLVQGNDGYYYFVDNGGSSWVGGAIVMNKSNYYVNASYTHDLVPVGNYNFDAQGRLTNALLDVTDKAAVTDYTVMGRAITVKSDTACKVGYLVDGKYVALDAIDNGDGTYNFAAPKDVDQVLVVLSGDANGDGAITGSDISALNASILGKQNLTKEGLLAADVNGDGRITAADMARLNAVVLVKPDAKPEW